MVSVAEFATLLRGKVDERVHARLVNLLAMTESPVEEEARTAAVLFVRLLREHVTAVCTALPQSTVPVSNSAMTGVEPLRIRSRFSGVCLACFERYKVGDWILWRNSRGRSDVTHAEGACPAWWNK